MYMYIILPFFVAHFPVTLVAHINNFLIWKFREIKVHSNIIYKNFKFQFFLLDREGVLNAFWQDHVLEIYTQTKQRSEC